jgi:homopolymeric O-antigen transport system ATP-binding protein
MRLPSTNFFSLRLSQEKPCKPRRFAYLVTILCMSNLAVSINNVSKAYHISPQRNRATTLGEAIGDFFSWRSLTPKKEEFWALRDVSLDVYRGEVLGIIGRNGAGKTTLLKILSRITEPTTGCVDLYGRVGSLLEVGTGFHPELTGRENIYLNGSVLGMSRSEIDQKFASIVAFAETEAFLDTPVKRYSSGMYVRLAFAVAAHLNPDILIVDEVLAVGDLQFQKKSMARMESAAAGEGKTILFVSHNMAAITKLCQRVALLDRGTIQAIGPVTEVVAQYLHMVGEKQQAVVTLAGDDLPQPLQRLVVRTINSKDEITGSFKLGEHWRVRLEFEISGAVDHCIAAAGLQTLGSIPLVTYWSQPADLEPGHYAVDFACDLPLGAGELTIVIGISSYERTLFYREAVSQVSIAELAVAQQPYRASGAGFIASFSRPRIAKISAGTE